MEKTKEINGIRHETGNDFQLIKSHMFTETTSVEMVLTVTFLWQGLDVVKDNLTHHSHCYKSKIKANFIIPLFQNNLGLDLKTESKHLSVIFTFHNLSAFPSTLLHSSPTENMPTPPSCKKHILLPLCIFSTCRKFVLFFQSTL